MRASRSSTQQQQQQQQQPAAQRISRARSPASRPNSIRQFYQTNKRKQHQSTQLKGQKGSGQPQQVRQHWRVRSRWRKAAGRRWCGALSAEVGLTSHRTTGSSHHLTQTPESSDSESQSSQDYHPGKSRRRLAREEHRARPPTPPPINARAALLLSPCKQRSIQKPQTGLAVTLVGDHSTKEPATTDSHRARR